MVVIFVFIMSIMILDNISNYTYSVNNRIIYRIIFGLIIGVTVFAILFLILSMFK